MLKPIFQESRERNITALLDGWSGGDREDFNRLTNKVHAELESHARRMMARQSNRHTLQTGGLVNEAWLRLIALTGVQWQDRRHFFAVAAKVMRRVLVDHARSGQSKKRGGNALRVTFNEDQLGADTEFDLLALDEALSQLASEDAVLSQIVELRFFGGLTVEQTAQQLEISPATVKRKWRFARAWLYRELRVR